MKISDAANQADFIADTHSRTRSRQRRPQQVLWGIYCDWEASPDRQSWHVVVNLPTEREAWFEAGRKLDGGFCVRSIRQGERIIHETQAIDAQLSQACVMAAMKPPE